MKTFTDNLSSHNDHVLQLLNACDPQRAKESNTISLWTARTSRYPTLPLKNQKDYPTVTSYTKYTLYKALTKNYILSQYTSLQWHKNYHWSTTQTE